MFYILHFLNKTVLYTHSLFQKIPCNVYRCNHTVDIFLKNVDIFPGTFDFH